MDDSLRSKAELLAGEIAGQARTAEDLNELMRLMMKSALEQMLNTEMDVHLGRRTLPVDIAESSAEMPRSGESLSPPASPGKRPPNRRNGRTPKTVRSDMGELTIDTPRDRAGTFEPQLIGKHVCFRQACKRPKKFPEPSVEGLCFWRLGQPWQLEAPTPPREMTVAACVTPSARNGALRTAIDELAWRQIRPRGCAWMTRTRSGLPSGTLQGSGFGQLTAGRGFGYGPGARWPSLERRSRHEIPRHPRSETALPANGKSPAFFRVADARASRQ